MAICLLFHISVPPTLTPILHQPLRAGKSFPREEQEEGTAPQDLLAEGYLGLVLTFLGLWPLRDGGGTFRKDVVAMLRHRGNNNPISEGPLLSASVFPRPETPA